MNINRKNYLVRLLKKIVDEKAASKPLKSWEKVGNGKTVTWNNELEPDLLSGTLECISGWESYRDRHRSEVIGTHLWWFIDRKSYKIDTDTWWFGSWRPRMEAILFFFLIWIEVDIRVKQACFDFCSNFPQKKEKVVCFTSY